MLPIQDTAPRRHPPLVTYALIGLNVLVFLFESSLSPDQLERLFYLFGVVPARYSHPEWAASVGYPVGSYWPFLTSMFLHGGLLHLAGNMWTLYIFGDNVEDRMGGVRFLIFYLLCGVAAGAVHWLTNASSTVPTIGASGAIAGALGAYFVLFPLARIVLLVPVFFLPLFFELPAVTYLAFWFLLQTFSGVAALAARGPVGGIAWWAHIGGFLCGVLLCRLFLRPRGSYRRHHADELGPEGAWYIYRY